MDNDVKDFLTELAQEPQGNFVYRQASVTSYGQDDVVGEGQLAIDLYQSDKNLVLEAPIGGVRSDDIDIEVTSTMIAIKGKRHRDHATKKGNYHIDECHWGSFSRQLELPTEVNPDKSQATIKNGVLRVTMPIFKKRQ